MVGCQDGPDFVDVAGQAKDGPGVGCVVTSTVTSSGSGWRSFTIGTSGGGGVGNGEQMANYPGDVWIPTLVVFGRGAHCSESLLSVKNPA